MIYNEIEGNQSVVHSFPATPTWASLTIASTFPPETVLLMGSDHKLGILLHQGILNFRSNKNRNLLALNLLTVQLDDHLLIAEGAAQALLSHTDPALLGPLNLVDAVGFGRPVGQLLERGQALDELVPIPGAVAWGGERGFVLSNWPIAYVGFPARRLPQ